MNEKNATRAAHRIALAMASVASLMGSKVRKKGEGSSLGGIAAKAQWAKRGKKKRSRRRK